MIYLEGEALEDFVKYRHIDWSILPEEIQDKLNRKEYPIESRLHSSSGQSNWLLTRRLQDRGLLEVL